MGDLERGAHPDLACSVGVSARRGSPTTLNLLPFDLHWGGTRLAAVGVPRDVPAPSGCRVRCSARDETEELAVRLCIEREIEPIQLEAQASILRMDAAVVWVITPAAELVRRR